MNLLNNHYILDKFDVILALAGVIFGLSIVVAYYLIGLNQISIGLTIFIVSLIHIIFRNRFHYVNESFFSMVKTHRLLVNLVFFLLFTISLILYFYDLYTRPLSYFLISATLIGLVGVEILFSNNYKDEFSILLKILLISFSTRMGIFYNYPSIIGYDAYSHIKIANLISATGFIPSVDITSKYFYYPLFHIFISTFQTFCSLSIKDSLFYSIGITSIICTIFVYLLGGKIAGKMIGLLSVLFFNFTNVVIVRGIANVTPGSLVLCYFLLLLFLLLRLKSEIFNKVLAILITFIMILTHQLSTFVSFMCIAFLYIGHTLYAKLHCSENKPILNFNYLLLFGIALQAYWMSTYVGSGPSFFEWVLKPFINVLLKGAGEYGSNVLIVGYEYERSFLETLILQINYLILPFLAIGGIFCCISNRTTTDKYSIALTTIFLYVIIYGFPLLGMRNLLTGRWMPIISIFLSILASIYVFNIIGLVRPIKWRSALIFVIIFIFVFLMITTPGINKDNPLVAKDTTIRNQFTYSEIYASITISSFQPEHLMLDSPFISCYNFYSVNGGDDVVIFDSEIISQKSNEHNAFFVLRRSTLEEPIYVSYSDLYGLTMATKLTKEFFNNFKSVKYAFVYNNGQVLGYR